MKKSEIQFLKSPDPKRLKLVTAYAAIKDAVRDNFLVAVKSRRYISFKLNRVFDYYKRFDGSQIMYKRDRIWLCLCYYGKQFWLNEDEVYEAYKHVSEKFFVEMQHGRQSKKLTATHVQEIRKLYASGGVTERKLAKKYRVTQANINHIINFKIWKSL